MCVSKAITTYLRNWVIATNPQTSSHTSSFLLLLVHVPTHSTSNSFAPAGTIDALVPEGHSALNTPLYAVNPHVYPDIATPTPHTPISPFVLSLLSPISRFTLRELHLAHITHNIQLR